MSPSGGQAPAEGVNSPRPDPATWPFVLLGLALFAVAMAAWRPMLAGVWHDDGVYVMLGKALAHGDGLRYVGVVHDPPAPKFPPLYPAVLASLWLAFGEVGPVTLAAEMLNLGLLAVAGALLGWALHRHAGLPRGAAAVAGLLAFASADVLRPALIPLSEPLFLALLMAVLASWRARDLMGRRAVLLAALLALTVLTRTAGAAVVVGVGMALLLRAGLKRALLVLLPALLSALAWGAWAARRAADIPEELRDVLGPYVGWLAGQIVSAPLAFAARLPTHAGDVAERAAALLLPGLAGSWAWLALIPLAPLAALGAARLLRVFPPFVLTAAAYLALLLVWPYVDRRLVAPLHPFLVAMVVAGLVQLWERRAWTPVSRPLVAYGFLWMGAYTVMTSNRIAHGWPEAAYEIRADAMATGLETLARTAPEGSVVGAPELWAGLWLHGGWTVVPSARFVPAAPIGGRPLWGTPQEQIDLWRVSGVDHLLLEQGGTIHGEALNLQETLCPGSVTVLARMPPQILVRLDLQRCGS